MTIGCTVGGAVDEGRGRRRAVGSAFAGGAISDDRLSEANGALLSAGLDGGALGRLVGLLNGAQGSGRLRAVGGLRVAPA